MFEQDLIEWQKVEREFAIRLLKYDILGLEFSNGKFPDWDIKATFLKDWVPVSRTYEIKWDRQVEDTGNVWIEFMFNWQPSGIYTSKADYIVYKLWDKFYYADRLKFLIELTKPSTPKREVCGWDKDLSQMFLLNKETFKLMTTEI